MTAPLSTAQPDPTGLDYQEAFRALYPGLALEGRKPQDMPDDRLRLIDRAARLRRAERERVKAEFLVLAEYLDSTGDVPGAGDEIRAKAEEIR